MLSLYTDGKIVIEMTVIISTCMYCSVLSLYTDSKIMIVL